MWRAEINQIDFYNPFYLFMKSTYHDHSTLGGRGQDLAPGRFTSRHSVKGSIVASDLRHISFQLVIVVTFNGDVLAVHHSVAKTRQIDDTTHGYIRD